MASRRARPTGVHRAQRAAPNPSWFGVVDRMVGVIGTLSYREVARRTRFNHETIRRYMNYLSEPGASFIVDFTRAFAVEPKWLLMGKGPSREALAQGRGTRKGPRSSSATRKRAKVGRRRGRVRASH